MKMIQAKLKKGNCEQTAWIEKKKGVQVGCSVELKSTGEFWNVVALYGIMDSKILDNKIKMDKNFGLSIK